jgi:hypothetical protein
MNSANGSVHLEPEVVRSLDKSLSDCRHNVNNSLAMIMSALELIQFKPESTEKLIGTAMDHSKQITRQFESFARELDRALHRSTSKTTK